MFHIEDSSVTCLPDKGSSYPNSYTQSKTFENAKFAFISFLVSFFSEFVVDKLTLQTEIKIENEPWTNRKVKRAINHKI